MRVSLLSTDSKVTVRKNSQYVGSGVVHPIGKELWWNRARRKNAGRLPCVLKNCKTIQLMSEKSIACSNARTKLDVPKQLPDRITFSLSINGLQRKGGLLFILSLHHRGKK